MEGLLSSVVLGALLGFTFFAFSEQLGLNLLDSFLSELDRLEVGGRIGTSLRTFDFSEMERRIGVGHFVAFGAIFGAILDFTGRLFSGGR